MHKQFDTSDVEPATPSTRRNGPPTHTPIRYQPNPIACVLRALKLGTSKGNR